MMYNPLVFISCFLSLLSCLYGFGRYAYGAFLPSIRDALNLSYLELGSISTLATLGYVVTTVLVAAVAVHVNTRLLLAISGGLCVIGLLMIAQATSFVAIAAGICLAGLGAAIAPAVYVELIDISLQGNWKNGAVSAINAGATPGIVATGIVGMWLGDTWRDAWFLFAGAAVIATLWNVAYFPSLTTSQERQDYLKIRVATFLNRGSLVLAVLAAAYGYHLGFYYTFSVDYAVEEFGFSVSHSKVFWTIVGAFGLPAIFTGAIIKALGLQRLLLLCFVCYSASGLVLLADPLGVVAVYVSAALFGLTSIATGGALMVLSSDLYSSRPSLGFGVFYVAQATALIVSPLIGGVLTDVTSRAIALTVSVVVVLSVLPVVISSAALRTASRDGATTRDNGIR